VHLASIYKWHSQRPNPVLKCKIIENCFGKRESTVESLRTHRKNFLAHLVADRGREADFAGVIMGNGGLCPSGGIHPELTDASASIGLAGGRLTSANFSHYWRDGDVFQK
jgi:hypothetical protein